MPRLASRQEPAPSAYHEGHGLDSLIVAGVDPMAARRAYLRETHRLTLERERAREQAIRAAAMPESEAAAIAQDRIEQERALTKRRG